MKKAQIFLTIDTLDQQGFSVALDMDRPDAMDDESENIIPVNLPDPQTEQILRLLDVHNDGIGFLKPVAELLEKILGQETDNEDEHDEIDGTKIFNIFLWKDGKGILKTEIWPPEKVLSVSKKRIGLERYHLYEHDDEDKLIRAIYECEVVQPYFHTFFLLLIQKAYELRNKTQSAAV